MAEICPLTKGCPVYKNWTEQTIDKRINIIIESFKGYECLAKMAIESSVSEGGILINEEIKERLKDLSSPCSHLTLLTLLYKIQK